MTQVLNDPAALAAVIAARTEGMTRPFVVALDGRSGVGKSTLARMRADGHEAAIIEGDDFYAGGMALRDDSPGTRAASCIDWTRQRPVLEDLRTGRKAVRRAFDWESFDGRLYDQPTRLAPKAGRDPRGRLCRATGIG